MRPLRSAQQRAWILHGDGHPKQSLGDFYALPRDREDMDVYLRLVKQNGSLTGYYATRPGEWQRIGAFGNYFSFVSVGIGATQSLPENMNAEDIEALFDYFEIALP